MGKLYIAMCTLVLMDTLDMAAYAGAPPNHLNHATPLITSYIIEYSSHWSGMFASRLNFWKYNLPVAAPGRGEPG